MSSSTRASSRPRIVHVTTADISLSLLLGPQLQAFAAAGYEVIGVSAPGAYVSGLERDGIEHRAIGAFTRSFSLRRDARSIVELYRLLRDLDPDVVHTHNPKPGVFGRLAARAARVPAVVNTVHGLYATSDDPLAKRALVYGLERVAAACSDAELVQNPEDLELLARLGVPRRKLHFLGNGVDLGRFDAAAVTPERREHVRQALGIAPDEVVCGLVGRMVWEKGYREVFAAAARLRDEAPSLRFVVVGPDDPEKDDAVTPADREAAARSARIEFLGSRDDVEDLYAAMDLYVLASYREGFPRSAMEAAAMGLPVVATDIRGCREVVDHGETGVLVPPRDATALADAIGALAGDAGRRRSMGEAAVKKAQHDFDQRRVIDTTLDVYEELLGRSRGAADEIRLATTDDVARVAQLHATRIGTGFLSSLGERFLRRLYRRAVLSPDAFVLVAGDAPVDGFAAVALSTGKLYRSFVVRDGIVAGAEAAPGLLRTPRRTWETLRYPATTVDLPPAEVLSIAVDERASGRGLGGALAGAVEQELHRRGVDAARIVIAADNAASLGVFARRGWTVAERVELHSGTPSEVLVWQQS